MVARRHHQHPGQVPPSPATRLIVRTRIRDGHEGREVGPMTDTARQDAPSGGVGPTITDGRRLRRAVNREAVVDALLDLYTEGNLRPGTDEIAERAGISPRSLFRYFEDTDDLAREAISRQMTRVEPFVSVGVGPEAPFDERVAALVDQRLRLFDAVGQAAHVFRLRAPFQPPLAEALSETRRFLRDQVRSLFSAELRAMGAERAEAVLAAADVLTTFESYQLLTTDQRLTAGEVNGVLVRSLSVLLSPAGPR
jgi:AcrR family transcriptional regulator